MAEQELDIKALKTGERGIDKKELDALNKAIVPHWANPPSIMDITHDVNDARTFTNTHMEKILAYREARANERKDKCKTKEDKQRVKSRFSPKVVRRQNEWRYSSLSEPFLGQPELFKVKPKTHDDVERARQNNLILNHQFDYEINKTKLVDDIVRAIVDDGTVITKTGWLYQECATYVNVPQFKLVPPVSAAQIEELQAIMQEVMTNNNVIDTLDDGSLASVKHYLATQELLYPVEDGFKREKQTKVLKDRPDVIVCDPANVIIDPSCNGDIDKANFIAFEFETSKTELLSSGIEYHNLDQVDFTSKANSSDYMPELNEHNKAFNFSDEARAKVTAYEYWGYWDIMNEGVVTPIVVTFIGNVMIRAEVNPFNHNKLPFDVASLMPVRNSVYGEADAELISDDQDIIGSLSRAMIDLIGKSAGGQTAFAKGYLDPVNMRKYQRGMDYEVNGTQVSNGVYQHAYPEISGGVLNLYQMHNNNVDSNTGVKAFSGGLSGDSLGSSVGGIQSALTAAQKRELSILRRITELVISVGKKVIAMNSQYLTEDYVVRLTGNEFVTVATDDLEGKFDVNLDISSVEADNKRVAELSFLLQTAGNNLPYEIIRDVWTEITFLQKSYNLSKKIEQHTPQPDPLEIKKQELEIAKLQAEIVEIQAEAMEREAKAIKAKADAIKIQAEADKLDLDFIEQESGVTQERALEKQREQGLTNIALEQTKQQNTSKGVET